MGIKGKTTFELTDVNTGKVEVIEDANMITNGIEDFLNSYGIFANNLFKDSNFRATEAYNLLTSGLLLFDTALDENVTNTFMPAGVKMIGNGAKGISNSGEVLELGSYNASESGLQVDGSIKYVYDFSTQQANGSIACACLTSNAGGYIGMGGKNGYYNNSFMIDQWQSNEYCTISMADASLGYILYPVYSENALYTANKNNLVYASATASEHWSVTKKIKIDKRRVAFNNYNLNDYSYLETITDSFEVSIPQDILAYMGSRTNYVSIRADGTTGNIFVIFRTTSIVTLDSGQSVWIMKIDKSMNVTSYNFTNNLSSSIRLSETHMVFNGDYIWCQTSDKLYGIKYADCTQIVETNASIDLSLKWSIAPNLIAIQGKAHSTNTYYNWRVYDAVNNVMLATNGYVGNSGIMIPFLDKKGVYLRCDYTSSKFNLRVIKDVRYLATINNLLNPVVKTASKTMKVTYTLTFGG
jgi:hypothetical protein